MQTLSVAMVAVLSVAVQAQITFSDMALLSKNQQGLDSGAQHGAYYSHPFPYPLQQQQHQQPIYPTDFYSQFQPQAEAPHKQIFPLTEAHGLRGIDVDPFTGQVPH